MKTKSFLLIVLFSIGISTTSFAQNQGPTLTETIDWIKGYLRENGEKMHIVGSKYTDHSFYYENIVNFNYETKTLTFTTESKFNVSINFSNCISVKKGKLTSIAKNLVKVEYSPEPNRYDYNYTSNEILFGLNENGDYTKLDKALKHLCELCGVKFYKEDLF